MLYAFLWLSISSVAASEAVAREVEAVVINCYRNTLRGQGFLRVHSQPIGLLPRAA